MAMPATVGWDYGRQPVRVMDFAASFPSLHLLNPSHNHCSKEVLAYSWLSTHKQFPHSRPPLFFGIFAG